MFRKFGVVLMILMLLVSVGYGQKVKYKDLFVLLNSKKYEDALPFLNTFLANPKNSDHPNANYQKGLIFEDMLKHNDVLEETELYKQNADTAIHYFNNARGLIDEKEVKKNDAYYQQFNRRDLRTGKFGISISDVHLDIENRIKELDESRQNVTDLKKYFIAFSSAYFKCDSLFQTLKNKFGHRNKLLWQIDEEDNSTLNQINSYFDKTRSDYNQYRSTLEKVKDPGYDQQIKMKEVTALSRTEHPAIDFKQSEIVIYDYKSWVSGVKNEINNVIEPLRKELVSFDKRLEELRMRVNNEVVEVWEELGVLKNDPISNEILKFDPDPLPVSLFNYKFEEINYLSEINRHKIDGSLDSMDVNFQIELSQQLLEILRRFEFISRALFLKNVAEAAASYRPFINSNYGSVGELERFISDRTLFVQGQKDTLSSRLNYWQDRNKWAISENDSISLVLNNNFSPAPGSTQYLPFWVGDSLKNGTIVSSGLIIAPDTISGYNLGADQIRNLTFLNKIELAVFEGLKDYNQVTFLVANNEDIFINLYCYQQQIDSNYKSVIAKVNFAGEIQWVKNFDLPKLPYSVALDNETGDIIVHYGLESAESEVEEENALQFVIDSSGSPKTGNQ